MSETRFTDDHEWARLEGELIVVGITNYARRSNWVTLFLSNFPMSAVPSSKVRKLP